MDPPPQALSNRKSPGPKLQSQVARNQKPTPEEEKKKKKGIIVTVGIKGEL